MTKVCTTFMQTWYFRVSAAGYIALKRSAYTRLTASVSLRLRNRKETLAVSRVYADLFKAM